MKIRNSKTNIKISSPHICKGSYNGKDVFLDENFEEFFYLRDGWEEVKGETEFADKWHDLRKDPDDLPSSWRNVYIVVEKKACFGIVRTYKLGFYLKDERQWVEAESRSIIQYEEKVIAWREKPTFNED